MPGSEFDVIVDTIIGRLDAYPLWYPSFPPPALPRHLLQASEEDVGLWLIDQQEELSRQASEVYDIKRWVIINCTVNLPFETWMNMPSVLREATVNEVNAVVREKDKSARDARERIESQLKGNDVGKLQFPVSTKSYTENFFR